MQRLVLAPAALVLLLAIAAGCRDHDSPPAPPPRDEPALGALVTQRHPARGLTRVVLRASGAALATVRVEPGAADVVVEGRARMSGLHEPPAPGALARGGFALKPFGATLLAATRGEFTYIHFGLDIIDITLTVPPGVEVVREPMRLNGDMEPDLRPPGAPPRPEGRP